MADFEKLAKGCDLLVIPAVPSKLDIEALKLTLAAPRKVGTEHYRILLTKCRRPPQNDGEILRDMLKAAKAPLFKAEVPLLKSTTRAPRARGKPTKRPGGKSPMAKSNKFNVDLSDMEAPAVNDRPHARNEKRGPGRPIGKRSNPAYRQYSVLIRIDTHDRAIEKLRKATAKRISANT